MKTNDLIGTLSQANNRQRARSYEFWYFRKAIMKKYLNYDTRTPLSFLEKATSRELRTDTGWSHLWHQDSNIPRPVLDRYVILLNRMVEAKSKYDELSGKY